MNQAIKPYSRKPKVLELLFNYGPLSRKAIGELLAPPMSIRQSNRCLRRLKSQGLVVSSQKVRMSHAEFYYQLSYNRSAVEDISKELNLSIRPEQIPTFRGHDVEHSVVCAYWGEYFKRLFPHCNVVRDFHLTKDIDSALGLLGSSDIDFFPDLVVKIGSKKDTDDLLFAVEVERSLKSRGRILQKVYKYAAESLFDGVIYLCPTYRLVDIIADIYSENVKCDARRIRKYGDNFLVFAQIDLPDFSLDQTLITSGGENIKLSHWIHNLTTTEWHSRTDRMFANGPRSGAMLENAQ